MKRALIPTIKEPVGLLWQNGKRPDGPTILPWSRGKPLAWHVAVPGTYADDHVGNTTMEKRASAILAATNKTNKCNKLSATHIFTPVTV